MYDTTLTLFNYHKATNLWYTTVFHGADVIAAEGSGSSVQGIQNKDVVDIIIRTNALQIAVTPTGAKQYLRPKEYGACGNPESAFTFTPQTDFIVVGDCGAKDPLKDDEDSGLYHRMNDTHDGVYLIHTATYYSLLPHFEIGGA